MTRLNRNKWVLASERLPTKEEAAGFGGVECILQCRGSHDFQSLHFAHPIHIGGGDRIIWNNAIKGGSPIENSSWEVTHWRPFPKFPKPLPNKVDKQPLPE